MGRSFSFANLTKLTALQFSQGTLKTIEQDAISFLPSFKQLDLSHQQLESLPKKMISNCPNLTDVDLSYNLLTEIHEESLVGLDNLNFLDLSNNQLEFLGDIIQFLDNQDIVVDLSDNSIQYLEGTYYKPFIEKKRKGYINLANNELDCRCDVQWLLNSNLLWNDLFQNALCANGLKLQEVDAFLLKKMCPSSDCPKYGVMTARFKKRKEIPA